MSNQELVLKYTLKLEQVTQALNNKQFDTIEGHASLRTQFKCYKEIIKDLNQNNTQVNVVGDLNEGWENLFQNEREQIMLDWGLDEGDMDGEEIENSVNREAEAIMLEKHGIDITEL